MCMEVVGGHWGTGVDEEMRTYLLPCHNVGLPTRPKAAEGVNEWGSVGVGWCGGRYARECSKVDVQRVEKSVEVGSGVVSPVDAVEMLG